MSSQPKVRKLTKKQGTVSTSQQKQQKAEPDLQRSQIVNFQMHIIKCFYYKEFLKVIENIRMK